MKKLVSGALALVLALSMVPAMAAGTTAAPTNDMLTVDGVVQNPTVYKINDSNYFKIRDLAAILNGTSKQFAVGYDASTSSVTATTGEGYTKTSADLVGPPAGGSKFAELSSDVIYVNGVRTQAEVYKIDGSNYFKLRDLGDALGFDVGWTEERGMFIETSGTTTPITTTKPDGAIGGRYDTSVYTVPADANKDGWITESEVQARIEELKVQYPPFTKWNDASIWGTDATSPDGYINSSGLHYYRSSTIGAGTGCAAWAKLLSDRIFGNLPQREFKDAYSIRPGDIIWDMSSPHWMVYLCPNQDNSNYMKVSDSGSKSDSIIGWGGNGVSFTDEQSYIDDGYDKLYTRYPAE